ncbi:MAG TPA: globin domain-containing protein [Polyangiaceae bacterium LLY-WYZ-15_(1-7)]|nr:globin [Myxococcales bacterium]MAT25802.1 globin [Sandaracinus sp.]HJL04385.1 globin domain-containing protein [Polyangiaceae bacterium LLY-WYZ-15_(1-7)]MBJ70716.1 globin [Sandaracinus sp.]HJL11838.1 globin domain-containing protein [Polyangiaceae bacterium LLY-WYZ-15_(1-7)]
MSSPLLDHSTLHAVRSSFERVREPAFAAAFYERLLARDPEIRRRFAHTDFERQRELFLHGLFALVDYASGGATGKLAIERLHAMHGPEQLDVPAALFDVWRDVLLETLAEHDPEWRGELAVAWRAVLGPGIDAVRSP